MCSAHVSSLPHPFGFLPRRPRRIRAPSRFCGNGSESRAAALCGKTSGATSEDRRIFPQGVSSGIDDGPWEALRCADLLGWATSSRRGRPVHRSCQYAGLAGDTYVVLTEITASAVAGALIAGAALLLLVGLWHAFPAVVRLSGASIYEPLWRRPLSSSLSTGNRCRSFSASCARRNGFFSTSPPSLCRSRLASA